MKRGRLKKEFLLYFRLFFVLALAVIVLMGAAQYFSSYRSIEKNTLSGGAVYPGMKDALTLLAK